MARLSGVESIPDFDVEGARQAGYSDQEIEVHLRRKMGHSPQEAKIALRPEPGQFLELGKLGAPLPNNYDPGVDYRTAPQATYDRIKRMDSAGMRDPMNDLGASVAGVLPQTFPVVQGLTTATAAADFVRKPSVEKFRQLASLATGYTAPSTNEEGLTSAPGPAVGLPGMRAARGAGTPPEPSPIIQPGGIVVPPESRIVSPNQPIFMPEKPAVAGATAQELRAMQKGTLSEKTLQRGYEAGKGNTLLREGLQFTTPEEYGRLVNNKASLETFNRMLQVLPRAEHVTALAKMGAEKKGWYRASTRAIMDVFGPDAPRFTALLAAMSPQTSVESNLLNATKTWTNWVKAGRPTSPDAIKRIMGASVQGTKGEGSVLGAWLDNSISALTSDNLQKLRLSGPKVNSFYRNLMGDVYAVTNDTHIANIFGVQQKFFSGTEGFPGPRYAATSARTRQGAQDAGMLPMEGQESIWSVSMPLNEASRKAGMTPREFLAQGRLTPDLIRGTPDFSTLLRQGEVADTLGQMYDQQLGQLMPHVWGSERPANLTPREEAYVVRSADTLGRLQETSDREGRAVISRQPKEGQMPSSAFAFLTNEPGVTGISTGHLPDTRTATPGSKKAFSSDVEGVFKDPRGHNVILQGVGLPDTIATRNATGSWRPEGGTDLFIPSMRERLQNNPATAAAAEVPVIARRIKGSQEVEPGMRQADKIRMSAAAAYEGAATAQDAGAWHSAYPWWKGLALRLLKDKKADPEAMGLAATLLDEPPSSPLTTRRPGNFALSDVGEGIDLLNFGGQHISTRARNWLAGLLSDVGEYRKIHTEGDLIDYAKQWQKGPGSQEVTKKMFTYIDQLGKGDYDSLDRAVRRPSGDLVKVYEQKARSTKQPVREDLMNMLRIMRDQGLDGVKQALASGGFLPAIGAAVLLPGMLSQQNAPSSRSEPARAPRRPGPADLAPNQPY